jgi:hypothetical protein
VMVQDVNDGGEGVVRTEEGEMVVEWVKGCNTSTGTVRLRWSYPCSLCLCSASLRRGLRALAWLGSPTLSPCGSL